MGDESGLGFLKELSAIKKLRDIPVIVITATGNRKIEEKSISFGAYKFFTKPIVAKDVIMAAKQALRERKAVPLEVRFDEESPTVKASFKGDISKINELSLQIITPIKLPIGQSIEIESEFLDRLGASDCYQRTIKNLGTKEGGFVNELHFVGMNEEIAKKIRKIRK